MRAANVGAVFSLCVYAWVKAYLCDIPGCNEGSVGGNAFLCLNVGIVYVQFLRVAGIIAPVCQPENMYGRCSACASM